MRVSIAGIKLQPAIKANLARRLIETFATVEVGQFSEAIAAKFRSSRQQKSCIAPAFGLSPSFEK